MDSSELYSKTVDHSAIRHYFMQKSWENFNPTNRNELISIYYQTNCLCLGYRLQNCINSQQQSANNTFSSPNNQESQENIHKQHQALLFENYLQQAVTNTSGHKQKANFKDILENKTFEASINRIFEDEIVAVIKEWPEEWTVIQLVKNFNASAVSSIYQDIVSFNNSILVTVMKHSACSSEPFLIEIPKPPQSENMYSNSFNLSHKIMECAPADRELYWKKMKECESDLSDIINSLKKLFSPFLPIFTGKFKSQKSILIQQNIEQAVNNFFDNEPFKFSTIQQNLIHLLARRVDLQTPEAIFYAITRILKDKPKVSYSDTTLNGLYDLLTYIKQEYSYEDVETYPVILIVDELLDQLPFEMINPNQEIARVSSFHILKTLYNKYSSRIKNGYLRCNSQQTSAIINPDGSLKNMETRISGFFQYWFPSWKTQIGSCNPEQFKEMVTKSDVFVYCGHGTGLQYVQGDEIQKLNIKSVVFLFGCGSVSLSSTGFNRELRGSHLYYHLGSCPVVVGMLWTVMDCPTDEITTKLLSTWFPGPPSKCHWHNLDRQIWKKSLKIAFKQKTETPFASDNLLEAISKTRNDPDLSYMVRSALVYRGLPVLRT